MTEARAAVGLFLYARPDHAQRVIDALGANTQAAESDLFVFCDAAKGDADRALVQAVRAIAAAISGFKSVTVVMADTNHGISRSIRDGVSTILQHHDRVIVVEDDVELSPLALTYFNAMLDHYAAVPEVASISGFAYADHAMPLPPDYPHDVYFTPRLNCWGWATWRDRWQSVEWDPPDADQLLAQRSHVAALQRAGNDLPGLWRLHREGAIDSWAVPWTCDQIRRGRVTVHPRHSFAKNIGLDGSGTHGIVQDAGINQPVLSMATTWTLPPAIGFNRKILWAHKDYYDRLMSTGRLRRWLSVPAWWVRLARRKAVPPAQSLANAMVAAAATEAARVAREPRRQPGEVSVGGRTIKYADLHSFYHQANQIFGSRLYEFSTPNREPLILDCGAHIGLASMFFKDRYPNARIRAFEADAAIARLCRDNLAASGFGDVDVTAAAVWSHDRGVAFDLSADDAGHVVEHGSRVASIRLRDEIERGPVDLLKLDIEGAEFEVLRDCGDALRGVRRMIVEVHVFGHSDDRVGTLLTQIEAQGFRYALGDLHHATWKESDSTPFGAVPTAKYYFTVFAWRPD